MVLNQILISHTHYFCSVKKATIISKVRRLLSNSGKIYFVIYFIDKEGILQKNIKNILIVGFLIIDNKLTTPVILKKKGCPC